MDSFIRDQYEAVIGLEVHAQLLTNSKAYSSDKNIYGEAPNTNVSPITLGHPGTLPLMNEKTIDYAIKLGISVESTIAEKQIFSRKNYFYPDLPKGYQITQDTTPICTGGKIYIKIDGQREKIIHLTRIHMEEDAGKSIHDVDINDTLVDLNRAGTPLLEIVSEPDIRSSEEAYQYLIEIRKLLRYLDICDGNMEEGSMRCDANISVRKKGSIDFGTKVEVKNMNSMRNVRQAIEFEINRQITCLENNELIYQETRGFDALKGSTISMRTKEAANDYRYFPEPDLQPLFITENKIKEIKNQIPELPRQLYHKFTETFGLSDYDATNLIESKGIANYYNEIVSFTSQYKMAANWVMGDIKSYLNTKGVDISEFPISSKRIAQLIELIHIGKISNSSASQRIFPYMLENSDNPNQVAEKFNLFTDNSQDSLDQFIEIVINQNPNEVQRFLDGDKKLLGFFMGQLMKLSKGKVDPKSANQLIIKKMESLK